MGTYATIWQTNIIKVATPINSVRYTEKSPKYFMSIVYSLQNNEIYQYKNLYQTFDFVDMSLASFSLFP